LTNLGKQFLQRPEILFQMKKCLGMISAAILLCGCTTTAPVSHPARAAFGESLTYPSLVNYFDSTGMRATEVQSRCTIFSEGEWFNPNHYDYCLIILENSDEDLQVTFYLTDAHEMNWITEFLDSSFFTRAEKEKLFGMIQSEREVHGERVGRYRVNYRHWEPRHAQIFVFSFTRA
jgi:hypothetical protein